jgi:GntR family transcriptional regulator
MYVTEGARSALMKSERDRFLTDEWPALYARLTRLGLSLRDLMAAERRDEELK